MDLSSPQDELPTSAARMIGGLAICGGALALERILLKLRGVPEASRLTALDLARAAETKKGACYILGMATKKSSETNTPKVYSARVSKSAIPGEALHQIRAAHVIASHVALPALRQILLLREGQDAAVLGLSGNDLKIARRRATTLDVAEEAAAEMFRQKGKRRCGRSVAAALRAAGELEKVVKARGPIALRNWARRHPEEREVVEDVIRGIELRADVFIPFYEAKPRKLPDPDETAEKRMLQAAEAISTASPSVQQVLPDAQQIRKRISIERASSKTPPDWCI